MKQYNLPDNPFQQLTVDVRGRDIILKIYQNTYSNYWYMDISLPDGSQLAYGEKLVSGIDLGFKFDVKGIYIADGEGNDKDPDEDGLKDIYLYVLDQDELDPFQRQKAPEPIYLIDSYGNPLVDDNNKNLIAGYETL